MSNKFRMFCMNPFKKAQDICLRLRNEGYIAYFAGGWVRDWLLDTPSSDIDIATDAPLNKIVELFPRTNLVGLSFGVVIVQEEGFCFEVATFRRDISYTNGRSPDRVEPSDPLEDAKRRDFTINGMFYDPIDDKLYDYVGGEEDLKKGVIRAIGDPLERFFEDRLRMIRAIRFAARFGFYIEPETEKAIQMMAKELFPAVVKERIYQELFKMHESAHFDEAMHEMHKLGLLQEIFPSLRESPLSSIKKVIHKNNLSLPMIALLRELLKESPLETQLEELGSLKISTKERELIEFLHHAEKSLRENLFKKRADWARFYAHPSSSIALHLVGETLEHELRQKELSVHIERIRTKKPLVTSEMLREIGVVPGKEMGRLLKEAETLTIDEDIVDPQVVLKKLGSSHA